MEDAIENMEKELKLKEVDLDLHMYLLKGVEL